MPKNTDWPSVFLDAMEALQGRMSLAMQAEGCREQWLQAEVMMFAYEQRGLDLWTNCEPVCDENAEASRRNKHDWAAYGPDEKATMVAELKVMAGSYQQGRKCLLGASRAGQWHSIVPPPGKRHLVAEAEIDATPARDWGLVPDAARLCRHPAAERYLVLVLLGMPNDAGSTATMLHAAMDGITFVQNPDDEHVRRFDGFTAKVWRL